jgi:6,7-dimethyl-8-ribityllumazine synthase
MSSAQKSLSDIEAFGAKACPNAKVAIVTANWNHRFTYLLRDGALQTLTQLGIHQKDILSFEVPGAFELPLAAARILNQVDAVICIGCVIKGDTPHFDYICQGVTNGIMQLNLSFLKPVIFGVLTVDTEEQAQERCGGIHGNKGIEAAATCIKMLQIPGAPYFS